VIALWKECQLTRPWNDPRKDIARKLAVQPELFLVGPWRNRRHRHGRIRGPSRMGELPRGRAARARPLLVRNSNPKAIAFYRRLGYAQDDSVSLGKRLISDEVG
jgi:hypothetical protein